MKSKMYEMMMMYAMAGMMINNDNQNMPHHLTDSEIDEIREKQKKQKKRMLLKKGMQVFEFSEVTILALNEKNANRKYENFKKKMNENN
jgi:hypothetical protein